ncbi:hypothetical protein F5Y17DRAFT_443548 [Xylariaceae sp. FL0594]|nr:hypothetical protein F5Y17DRAFT_443548 [Xylariaceae sp. FL0594]
MEPEEETDAFMRDEEDDDGAVEVQSPGLTRAQAMNLYVSHAFSTWNARGYEFAAILFTATAYPDTLVAAALRMIIIYIAMILFSSTVGHWVERSPNRLRTLLSTILCNRSSVIVGSIFWLLILNLNQEDVDENVNRLGRSSSPVTLRPRGHILKGVLFAMAVACGIIERLSTSANMISMERDWVVTVAGRHHDPYNLTHLNAIMRRIDLVCKLLSPILISLVISAWGSAKIGVLYTGLTSLVSVPVEVFSARRVWKGNEVLRRPKPVPIPPNLTEGGRDGRESSITSKVRSYLRGMGVYFSQPVWIPSFALAMLHFNMLTWRATFITYLINVGYSLDVITVARTIGSVFEISSTVLTPRGVVYLGKAKSEGAGLLLYGGGGGGGEDDDEGGMTDAQTVVGLQRLGLWGLSGQLVNTVSPP